MTAPIIVKKGPPASWGWAIRVDSRGAGGRYPVRAYASSYGLNDQTTQYRRTFSPKGWNKSAQGNALGTEVAHGPKP